LDAETRIDVPEVRKIAEVVANVGSTLTGDARDMAGHGAAGGTALHGSELCARLQGFADSYATTVTDLSRQIEAFGADIDRTALDYQRSDEQARARITAAGGPGTSERLTSSAERKGAQ
jgi:hypothetical protein